MFPESSGTGVKVRDYEDPLTPKSGKKRVGAPGNTEEQDATMLGYHKLPTGGYSEDGEE